jgi:HAD superfamily hydrolase (TIGR01549 family)
LNLHDLKVVAFDCDGVMFDSSKSNRAYYDHILAHFERPPMTDEQFVYAHMHTVNEALAHLFDDRGTLEQVLQYCRKLSYMPFIRHMVIEPHLKDVLARLRPVYYTAIATNRTNTMAHVLEEHGLTDAFDKVVTAGDVRRAKPDPEQLLVILAHFQIDSGQMLYIGDSPLDAMAAQQAGVPFVAFGNPELEAQVHIQNLRQIMDLLGY